jgi:hypothetical protein
VDSSVENGNNEIFISQNKTLKLNKIEDTMTNLELNLQIDKFSENASEPEILTQYSVIQELSNIRKMASYYEEFEKYSEIVGFVNKNIHLLIN